MLTTHGRRTSHIAAVVPRAGCVFRCVSLQSCFDAVVSLQSSSTGAIAVVRHRAVESPQMPRAPASAENRRSARHQARPSRSRSRRSWAGWCRERPALAISDRNGCGWQPRALVRRVPRADPENRHPQRRVTQATCRRHRADIARPALSAPSPPKIFAWQAMDGGRIGEAMQPAWAWLPKSNPPSHLPRRVPCEHLLRLARRSTWHVHACCNCRFSSHFHQASLEADQRSFATLPGATSRGLVSPGDMSLGTMTTRSIGQARRTA